MLVCHAGCTASQEKCTMSERTSTAINVTNVVEESLTGIEDVARSLRQLARSTSDLGGAAADVLERELAMAIKISQQVRDRSISPEMLKRVRSEGLPARLRKDAHDVVDLVADLTSVVAVSAFDLLNDFVDERRPALPNRPTKSS